MSFSKRPKRKNMTARELELADLLTTEKKLTESWYQRMAGEKPWLAGEREMFASEFARLETAIKSLQAEESIEWFASLQPSA